MVHVGHNYFDTCWSNSAMFCKLFSIQLYQKDRKLKISGENNHKISYLIVSQCKGTSFGTLIVRKKEKCLLIYKIFHDVSTECASLQQTKLPSDNKRRLRDL